jgi:hypothetical protein
MNFNLKMSFAIDDRVMTLGWNEIIDDIGTEIIT